MVKQIVEREKHTCFSGARGSKRSLRGLYYSSPFIRDLQNCPELLRIFGEMIGEPVLPHANYSSSPQVTGEWGVGTSGGAILLDLAHFSLLLAFF